LGTKLINIKRGMSRQTIRPGAELASSQSAELQDIFQQSSSTIAALNLTIKKVNDIIDLIESGKGTIGELLVDDTLVKKALAILETTQAIANQAQAVVANLNSTSNSVGQFLNDNGELYGQVHDSLARVDDLIDKVNNGPGTMAKLLNDSALYDEARDSLVQVHDVLAGLQNGEGTAGKLLKSDELNNQIVATLMRVDGLLDKINNGQGSISRLLNDPTVAEDLDGLLRETQGLMKDFRANPKKFLRIKLGLF
jgi:phospholipid/cholesterol/gamma-HCH transport system substrate-binding protein